MNLVRAHKHGPRKSNRRKEYPSARVLAPLERAQRLLHAQLLREKRPLARGGGEFFHGRGELATAPASWVAVGHFDYSLRARGCM